MSVLLRTLVGRAPRCDCVFSVPCADLWPVGACSGLSCFFATKHPSASLVAACIIVYCLSFLAAQVFVFCVLCGLGHAYMLIAGFPNEHILIALPRQPPIGRRHPAVPPRAACQHFIAQPRQRRGVPPLVSRFGPRSVAAVAADGQRRLQHQLPLQFAFCERCQRLMLEHTAAGDANRWRDHHRVQQLPDAGGGASAGSGPVPVCLAPLVTHGNAADDH
jgi:hypothetical protein